MATRINAVERQHRRDIATKQAGHRQSFRIIGGSLSQPTVRTPLAKREAEAMHRLTKPVLPKFDQGKQPTTGNGGRMTGQPKSRRKGQ